MSILSRVFSAVPVVPFQSVLFRVSIKGIKKHVFVINKFEQFINNETKYGYVMSIPLTIDPACSVEYFGQDDFSCIRGFFEFRRLVQHYLFHIYLYDSPLISKSSILSILRPSTLCVTVSWISFWLQLTAAPARIALGITTLLNIVSMNYNLNQGFPAVSYMKAVDYWNCACFLFVVFSLVEFGIATVSNYCGL